MRRFKPSSFPCVTDTPRRFVHWEYAPGILPRLLASVALLCFLPALAADTRCVISFDSAAYDVCEHTARLTHDDLGDLADPQHHADSGIRVIKFEGPIRREQRDAIEDLGVGVLGYAPHHALVVRMAPSMDALVAGLDGVIWTGPFLPAWKIGANLANELQTGRLVAPAGIDTLLVTLHRDARANNLAEQIGQLDGATRTDTVSGGYTERIAIGFDPGRLEALVRELSHLTNVAAINLKWPARPMNSRAGWLHQSGTSPQTPIFDQGIFGCGQTLGVLDTGLHVNHCSFEDSGFGDPVFDSCDQGTNCSEITPDFDHRKVGAYYKWSAASGSIGDPGGHGTRVTASAIGNDFAQAADCSSFTTPGGTTDLDGTAPGAQVIFQEAGANWEYLNDFGGSIYHAADVAYANGARIHNNSWGSGCRDEENDCISGCQVEYRPMSQDADALAWDRPAMTLFSSAGNSGNACGPGADVSAPANAKNLVTVGSNQRGTSGENVSSFSSRGPASDRRTRPDLMAQGGQGPLPSSEVHTAQTGTACDVTTSVGTSLSSPTAAGLGALVREYLDRGFHPTGSESPADSIPDPSGALIRALMINGAAEMTGSGAGSAPNQDQGWGRSLLDSVLFFDGDSRQLWLHDATTGLETGQTDDFQVTVEDSGEPLKVTLVWHDYPAMVNADPHIVNQLRLEVETPAGAVWTQKLPPGGGLTDADPFQDTTTTDYDDRNTVHQIVLDSPDTGTYDVRVRGIQVAQGGNQPYAAVATGAFQATTPPGGLAIDPPVLEFGTVFVGQDEYSIVTLINQDTTDIVIDDIDSPGAPFFESADFTTCSVPSFSLGPGEQCDLEYRFAPTADGDFDQALPITDGTGATIGQIELEGTGTTEELLVDPQTTDFGIVLVGQTSPTATVFLENISTSTLEVASIDSPNPPFEQVGTSCPAPPFSMPPSALCVIEYEFTPGALGPASEQLSIIDDDGNQLASLTLTGNGAGPPDLDINPMAIDFGNVVESQTSPPYAVSLTNAGTSPVEVDNWVLPGPPFSLTAATTCPNPPFTLDVQGDTCDLVFTFTALSIGTEAATVEIDWVEDVDNIDLQGTGVSAILFQDRFEDPNL